MYEFCWILSHLNAILNNILLVSFIQKIYGCIDRKKVIIIVLWCQYCINSRDCQNIRFASTALITLKREKNLWKWRLWAYLFQSSDGHPKTSIIQIDCHSLNSFLDCYCRTYYFHYTIIAYIWKNKLQMSALFCKQGKQKEKNRKLKLLSWLSW